MRYHSVVARTVAVERKIPAKDVQSLVWDGDTLIDWAGGGCRFALDGTVTDRPVRYAYSFDAAALSPSGEYVALIARGETKAVLLHNGSIVRQLNRDFYHAEVYPFPLTFARLPDGREVVIYCPEDYRRLEIEDLVTGERITSPAKRDPVDIFQAGLSVSPSGRWLLSAGWVWHPVHVANFYDLHAAARDSAMLDKATFEPPGRWEVSSGAFVDDETAMVGTLTEFFGDENDPIEDRPGKHAVAVWRIGSDSYSKTIKLTHPPGALMPVGANFVVTFYEHPRLYDLSTGSLVQEWQIDSGKQTGAITWANLPPPIALQPERARFAVATPSEIHVVEIDVSALSEIAGR